MTQRTSFLLVLAVVLAGPAAAQEPVTLTLGGAARAAAERSAAPEAARLRAAQAESRVRQRRADLLPSLTAAASDGERTLNSASFGISFADPATGQSLFDPNGQVLGPVKTWDFRGTVRQSVLDPGALARLKAAHAGADASDAAAASVAQMAAYGAAAAYVRAQRADAQVTARLADSSLAAELLGIARAQLSAGVGVALDVTRAQAQLSTTRSQLIAARAERDRARIELARAAGLPGGTAIVLADSLPAASAAPPNEADALGRASQARADVAAATADSRAAEQQLRAIRAEALPALSLFADQGVTGKSTEHLLNTYTWGIQLSVPVFDGFRRLNRADEQRTAIREADLRLRDLKEQVAADVRTALVELQASAALLAATDERVSLAEQELAQARDRFAAGVTGNADVITAQLALNAARTQAIDARAALQAARVSLARAQGSLTELP
jgi:outer membrane protein TolC